MIGRSTAPSSRLQVQDGAKEGDALAFLGFVIQTSKPLQGSGQPLKAHTLESISAAPNLKQLTAPNLAEVTVAVQLLKRGHAPDADGLSE